MAEMKDKCGKCKFFYGNEHCTGYCKKYAPVYKDKSKCGFDRIWPMVQYWEVGCGDFKLKAG